MKFLRKGFGMGSSAYDALRVWATMIASRLRWSRPPAQAEPTVYSFSFALTPGTNQPNGSTLVDRRAMREEIRLRELRELRELLGEGPSRT
jgi:hypothetical protein